MAQPKKLGPAMGDLVEFNPNTGLSWKLQTDPIDVMRIIEDKRNPRFSYSDPEDIPPADDGSWIVVEQRDLFNNFGKRHRICKVSNLLTSTAGWVHGDSLKVLVAVDD